VPVTLETLPDLIDQVCVAVVDVRVSGGTGTGNGSGFAIEPAANDKDTGVIVTNAHVVAGGDTYTVRFHDGSECDAEVRLDDQSTDVALLRVSGQPPAFLPLRPLAQVRVGEPVIAIGSPYGLDGTVTSGIVSGLNRTMPAPNRIPIDNMIQTDALVNPGNSGGPLIGLDGLVVGVNDQVRVNNVLQGSSGLGFAIPSDTVLAVYSEICETGASAIRRAAIGANLRLQLIPSEQQPALRQKTGALVVDDPLAGSPAGTAGLRRGDVIVALDGVAVTAPGAIFRLLDRTRIDKQCEVQFLRDGSTQTAAIVPGERPRPDPSEVSNA
jgi:S1-C subfamily serine protease